MYYIVNKQTRELVRTSQTPINVDENVNEFGDFIQLKRVDDDTQPAFNAATQKLNRISTDDDVAHTRTFSFAVVSLTQPELDAVAERTASEATRQQIKTAYTALQNSTGTVTERIVRIERALAYLFRETVR